jgi:hypothetical protein
VRASRSSTSPAPRLPQPTGQVRTVARWLN